MKEYVIKYYDLVWSKEGFVGINEWYKVFIILSTSIATL